MAKRSVYLDAARGDATQRGADRVMVGGRGGTKKALRRYHLTLEEMNRLRARMAREGRFVSPYCGARMHTVIIESFVACGSNKYHPLHVLLAKFQELMDDPSTVRDGKTAWGRYASKTPKNSATSLPLFNRFLKMLEFLQRLGGNHPVGLKLAQLGACIDIAKDAEGMLLARLRTDIAIGDEVRPLNANRVRAYRKSVETSTSGLQVN